MRNFLTTMEIPEDESWTSYEACGVLDGIVADISAHKFLMFCTLGQVRISLTPEAATELASHLRLAAAAMERSKEQYLA